MKNKESQYEDIDLTGVVPHQLSAQEVEVVYDFIEQEKAKQTPFDLKVSIIRLLKNGKLSVGEIAECLNVSISRILVIRAELQKVG